ncbi:MAG TPA: DNA polymerase III subunit delta, partial [Dongiaceae bacterium]|nr:DNA polymerase III subunit delta [Dongiaceae bacterium]
QRQAAAASLAKTIAREQNVSFEAGAAEELAECVAGDLQRLKTEIDKLVTYAGDRKSIRREDVALMVISERAATVWEMADLLATRQPKPALDFLDRLLRDGEEPLSMLGAMAWMYRKLIEASELRSGGWHAARTLQMSPERADAAIHNARRISRPRLLAGLGALQRADDRLKHGGDSTRAVMEFLIAELAGPANATTPGAGR